MHVNLALTMLVNVIEKVYTTKTHFPPLALTVCKNIDGLVVPVEETEQTSLEGLQRTISLEDIGIELQIFWHILPVEQLIDVIRSNWSAART